MRRACLLGIALGFAATALAADAPVLDWPLSKADVDLPRCATYRDGVASPAPEADVLAALGLGGRSSSGGGWSAGEVASGQPSAEFRYLVAFKRPVEAGSVWFGVGQLRYLKEGSPYPPQPAREADWARPDVYPGQTWPPLAVLPPGTRTRALLMTETRGSRRSELSVLRVARGRLLNVTPLAAANADAEYTWTSALAPPRTYAAADVVRGTGAWQSDGPRERSGKIPRAPITDMTPSWFILSWDTQRRVSGVFLRDNFKQMKLMTFHGPGGVSPVAGTDREWKRARGLEERPGPHGMRWLSFRPVETRGLKLLITGTRQERYAKIDSLHALTELGRAPVPRPLAVDARPPFKIPYTLDRASNFTMVVDRPDGTRLRNVVARAERAAGGHEERWDLKDESGQYVKPGRYTWKAAYGPDLTLRYVMTPYPNIGDNAPENSPWLNGEDGPGGWLADHTQPSTACARGDRVWFGSGCAESGVSLIECDLTGKKLWGKHDFAAWTGPQQLAADERFVYAGAGSDRIWTVDRATKKSDVFVFRSPTAERKRGLQGLAARGGRLYVSVSAQGMFVNAASPEDVDILNCLPLHGPENKRTENVIPPNPRRDFMRLFRLIWPPPGREHNRNYLTWLESTSFKGSRNHIVLAFRRPVPVGSVVFPFPEGDTRLRLSVLKEGAPYPPDARRERDWSVFWEGEGNGWAVIPAPENTMTRAFRVTFDRGGDLEDLLGGGDDGGEGDLLGGTGGDDGLGSALGGPAGGWTGRLEGMRILRRRYENLCPTAKVRVSSGTVNALGQWDAERKSVLSEAEPGVYCMEWDSPQRIRGLAIREIEARRTEVDVFEGPPGARVDIAGDGHWRHVATYVQRCRNSMEVSADCCPAARYIDGFVDFGREVETRAVRLRVVEPWTRLTEAEFNGFRADRGWRVLDLKRCFIHGVAPLRYIGGEPPVDPRIAERIEVYDRGSKELLEEIHVASPGRIRFNPRGDLYAASARKIVRVDLAGGPPRDFIADVKWPRSFDFDSRGNCYVFDSDPGRLNVRVYDPRGRFLREIGKRGGWRAGPWDPARFCAGPWDPVDIAIDSRDQLWIVDADMSPKRLSLWTTAGEFKRDFLGNPQYGSGGQLDPRDKRHLYYGRMQFELDWETGRTRLKALTRLHAQVFADLPIHVDGRTYLVTRPDNTSHSAGVVYLLSEEGARLVAAVGGANHFPPLHTREVFEGLGGEGLADHRFTWTDVNGDEAVQLSEVELRKGGGRNMVGLFDHELGVMSGPYYYKVRRFLPGGAPVYEETPNPSSADLGGVRLRDGNFFYMCRYIHDSPIYVTDPAGRILWTRATEGAGSHAYAKAKPLSNEQLVAIIKIAGTGRTRARNGLGEFLVFNANSGIWYVVTADGLYVSRMFRDCRDPKRVGWSMREHGRGLDLSDVTAGQEHFGGYFCTTADGGHYAIAGHNHSSIVEVEGLEDFRRMAGTFEVAVDDIRRAQEWERTRVEKESRATTAVMTCGLVDWKIAVDGNAGDWRDVPAVGIEGFDISLRMAHDGKETLYLCYTVEGRGPMKNAGDDWRRLFKTGASVDLQLATDPAADPLRKKPAEGDLRLLMTFARGKPVAVLYRPVDPAAPAGAAWETHTAVCAASFDRVERLDGVLMAHAGGERNYCFEAAIPVAALGLRIAPDLRLKMDWGVLDGGPDGVKTLQRIYWANRFTNITADVAAEAQLHPAMWGYVRFVARSTGTTQAHDPAEMLKRTGGEDGGDAGADDGGLGIDLELEED